MNIEFAFEPLRKLAIFWYGKFEFEAVGDKWLHETNEEEEECTKPRKPTVTRQQPFKKGHIVIRKRHTQCVAFGESVLRSSIKNGFCRLNKIKLSECSASV